MSKRKGVSAQEKRDRLLTMLRDSKRPWSTKEVVSHFLKTTKVFCHSSCPTNTSLVSLRTCCLPVSAVQHHRSIHPSFVVFIFGSADLTHLLHFLFSFCPPCICLRFLSPPSPTLLYRKNPPRASDSTPWQCPKSCPLCSMTIWP
jgi:hypothetical protein